MANIGDVSGSIDHDVVDDLLTSVGRGDVAAFATFYDHTAPGVFGFLTGALGERAAVQSTGWVYQHVWRCAPEFDPTTCSAWEVLMLTTRQELAAQLCNCRNHVRIACSAPSSCTDGPAPSRPDS